MNQMRELSAAELLAEIEDVIRTAPAGDFRVGQPDAIGWCGRASALVKRWNTVKAFEFDGHIGRVFSPGSTFPASAMLAALKVLHEARHDLRLSEVGPLSVAVDKGQMLDYFEEVRKVLATANREVFFVDPYLNPEFVARYLPQVTRGVSVRLLGKKGPEALLPAVDLAAQQQGLAVSLRTAQSFHDRFLFIDGSRAFQSSASFKDGARLAPSLFAEVTDTFQRVQDTYEALWSSATVHR